MIGMPIFTIVNTMSIVQYLTNMVIQPHEISYSSSRSIHTKPHQRISSYEIVRYSIFAYRSTLVFGALIVFSAVGHGNIVLDAMTVD